MERIGLEPGSEIGGYRIVEPLGSGGMGTVYRAVDGGGTAVALKLLHPHIGADPVARDRLRREVAALQRLRHPAVAAVLDAEADSTEAFVVTELVDGPNLEEHVRATGPVSAVELVQLADGLRDVLEAVHAAGVVHRDLKPSNVLVTAGGPVLIDFGIAQAADDVRVTSNNLVVGTPGYLAPELLADAEPSALSDWWGWAAVLAFAATGRPPFGTRPMDAVLARSRAGDVDVVGLGPLTAGALRAALDPDPSLRALPEDVVADLEEAAVRGDSPPPTEVLAHGVPGPATRVLAQDGSTRAFAPAPVLEDEDEDPYGYADTYGDPGSDDDPDDDPDGYVAPDPRRRI
ncbi:MAG TPA: serine/threonine-protein kinase, partial [Pengzhenrongella sp.]